LKKYSDKWKKLEILLIMNNNIKRYLGKKPSEELFYFFKHDGSLNFEKKIVSGVILSERRYDKRKMKSEKATIRSSIVKSIKDYEHSPQLVSKLKSKLTMSIVYGILISLIVYLLPYGFSYVKGESITLSGDYTLVVTAILLSSYILYQIITYNRRINNLVKQSSEDCDLQKSRLEILDNMWHF